MVCASMFEAESHCWFDLTLQSEQHKKSVKNFSRQVVTVTEVIVIGVCITATPPVQLLITTPALSSNPWCKGMVAGRLTSWVVTQ